MKRVSWFCLGCSFGTSLRGSKNFCCELLLFFRFLGKSKLCSFPKDVGWESWGKKKVLEHQNWSRALCVDCKSEHFKKSGPRCFRAAVGIFCKKDQDFHFFCWGIPRNLGQESSLRFFDLAVTIWIFEIFLALTQRKT